MSSKALCAYPSTILLVFMKSFVCLCLFQVEVCDKRTERQYLFDNGGKKIRAYIYYPDLILQAYKYLFSTSWMDTCDDRNNYCYKTLKKSPYTYSCE